jgi:hypothetical protein
MSSEWLWPTWNLRALRRQSLKGQAKLPEKLSALRGAVMDLGAIFGGPCPNPFWWRAFVLRMHGGSEHAARPVCEQYYLRQW